MSRLNELGKLVASESDSEASPREVLFEARCRMFGEVRRSSSGSSIPRAWLLVAALVMVAAVPVVAMSLFQRVERRIGYTVDGGTTPPSAFFETAEKPSVVRFDEGSRVTVQPETGMRILETRPQSVTLSVERGRIDCQVSKRRVTEWTVRAGPFDIRVTGTEFATEWHPEPGRFELVLTEGSVEVSGPSIEGVQRVNAGERLVVGVNEGVKTLTGRNVLEANADRVPPPFEPPASAQATAAPTEFESPSEPNERTAPIASSASARTSVAEKSIPETPKTEPPSWESLAAVGQYRQAAAQIHAQGWEMLARTADVPKARLLADTLRMSGAAALARQVLLLSRERHGSGNETAFLLGKIAADQSHSPGEALKWFERYLQEEPSGALREQALGRCLELDQQVGATGVRDRARAYLAAYPKGTYAPLAARILSDDAHVAP